jgi:ferredoxin-type protein NapH
LVLFFSLAEKNNCPAASAAQEFPMLSRRYSQLASLLALHSSWGPELKWFCNPVLSCHSCVLSWFTCPVGVFVQYSGLHLFPLLALGTALLIGVLAGRLFCGWVCPFGFLQDMLHKIPSPKFALPKWAGAGKYLVLAFGVFLIPFFLGEETYYSFCRVCPASALQVTIPNLAMKGIHTITMSNMVKLGLLAVILGTVVFSSRAFCKVLCPIGALLAPLNYFSYHTVRAGTARCVSCKRCDAVCPTNVHPSERIVAGIPANRSEDCITCGDCAKTCPNNETQISIRI